MNDKKIICLTPVKNEEWILDVFLQAASLWADKIIILDQKSTDNSKSIALRYPKVHLLENEDESYDEVGRQKILIEAARKYYGNSILIALDADEFLGSNFEDDKQWEEIRSLKEGTALSFSWENIYREKKSYWHATNKIFGFVDDGTAEHSGTKIHSERLPVCPTGDVIKLDIPVLHLQYIDWARMKSKQRWYQCWERINRPKRSTSIYRQYHHMDSIGKKQLLKIEERWLRGYSDKGIDITNIKTQPTYWWDKEILKFFEEYGTEKFRKEAIWDIDWIKLAQINGYTDTQKFKDPRTFLDKTIQRGLKITQPYSNYLGKVDRVISYIFNY